MVDCLLALEPDLRESKEPIVFMIYGRGRALFSCLGKGIHRDNLIQDVEFITGACSCTVKEQNPGVDLLMCYNWDAAAESISQRYGTEEGSRYDFGGDALFPELIIPSEGQMPGEQATASDTSAAEDNAVAQVDPPTEPAVASNVDAATDEPAADIDPTAESGTEVATLTPDESVADSHDAADAISSASSFQAILWVGAGLLGALVVLFGATFIVLRPK